jgi:hypothetical protein
MSTNSPRHDTAEPLESVADLTAAPAHDARRSERAEMVLYGQSGIVEDLGIELRAECAARGIDWFDVLAAATRRCLFPGLPN